MSIYSFKEHLLDSKNVRVIEHDNTENEKDFTVRLSQEITPEAFEDEIRQYFNRFECRKQWYSHDTHGASGIGLVTGKLTSIVVSPAPLDHTSVAVMVTHF